METAELIPKAGRDIQQNESSERGFCFQPKPRINHPGDIYEQEADTMADKVLRVPVNKNENTFFKSASALSLQCKCSENKSDPPVQRTVKPDHVTCNDNPRTDPIFKLMGTDDPVSVITEADSIAIDLIDKTTETLHTIQGRIAGGDKPAVPTFNACLAESLHTRLSLDPENPETWKGSGPRSVNHFIRMVTNIRDQLTGGRIRYTCIDLLCDDSDHAWSYPPGGHFHIRLCQLFWKDHPNLRALILIHELAHIYFNTSDKGTGAGNSHCINGFIADINGLNNEVRGPKHCNADKISAC